MNVVGVGSEITAAHEAILPLVVKYLPALPVCEGNAVDKLVVVTTRVSVMFPAFI
jgi:hypothetical protein